MFSIYTQTSFLCGKDYTNLNKFMKRILLPCFALCVVACNDTGSNNKGADSSANALTTGVTAVRTEVKKEAVAKYDVPLEGDEANLNKWHYTVQLFETPDRFRYRVEMQYEEITGTDTITLPNFGLEPQPQIQKGASMLECIIGFLDKKGVFREFILVSAKSGQLNMKTLRQYSVVAK